MYVKFFLFVLCVFLSPAFPPLALAEPTSKEAIRSKLEGLGKTLDGDYGQETACKLFQLQRGLSDFLSQQMTALLKDENEKNNLDVFQAVINIVDRNSIRLSLINHLYGEEIKLITVFQGDNLVAGGDQGEDGKRRQVASDQLWVKVLFRDQSTLRFAGKADLKLIQKIYENTKIEKHPTSYLAYAGGDELTFVPVPSEPGYFAVVQDKALFFDQLSRTVLSIDRTDNFTGHCSAETLRTILH